MDEADDKVAANRITFRKLKPTIDQTYPKGRFVAIDEGQIVGDAATIPEMYALMQAQGRIPQKVVVVQAGIDYPKFAYILLS